MTEERAIRSILVSAALMLGVAGCPPVPDDESDAGVGGSAAGGAATGGSATGGTASVPVCDIVDSLPPIGSTCNFTGESRCDRSGNQCACQRGIWYCNTSCASTYPTEPSLDSACVKGSACTYPSGVSCTCVGGKWMCMGGSFCPAVRPVDTVPCTDLTGAICEYPADARHAASAVCECVSNEIFLPLFDAGSGSSWACMAPSACPLTQPIYGSGDSCPGYYALCSYGSTLCTCQGGTSWTCGSVSFLPFPIQI
jgi:hypothetical protein